MPALVLGLAATFAEPAYAEAVEAAATTDVRVVTVLAWLPGAAGFAAVAAALLSRPWPQRSRARAILGIIAAVLLCVAFVELVGSTGGRHPGAEHRVLEGTPAGAGIVAGALGAWAGLLSGGAVATWLRRRGGDQRSLRRRRAVASSTVAGCIAGLAVALLTR